MQREFLYKVSARSESLIIQKLRVEKITEKTIKFHGIFSKHRIDITDVDVLLVEDKSYESSLNASYMFTFDSSKLPIYQLNVLEHFLGRMENRVQEYKSYIDKTENTHWKTYDEIPITES